MLGWSNPPSYPADLSSPLVPAPSLVKKAFAALTEKRLVAMATGRTGLVPLVFERDGRVRDLNAKTVLDCCAKSRQLPIAGPWMAWWTRTGTLHAPLLLNLDTGEQHPVPMPPLESPASVEPLLLRGADTCTGAELLYRAARGSFIYDTVGRVSKAVQGGTTTSAPPTA